MTGLEPLLLGSAAAGSTAATAGLFGMGGSFALGQTLMTGGTLLSAMGSSQQADATSDAADYNAALAREEGKAEAARIRKESDQRIGAMRAGISKSGVTSAGSPMLALAESAAMGELDAMNAMWAGENEANLYSQKSSSAQSSKKYTTATSLLSGVGTSLMSNAV